MLIVFYNEIASWPIWPALILFLVAYISAYIAIYGASFGGNGGSLSLLDSMVYFAPGKPLTTRQKWIAWLVGIIAGLCAIMKFGIDIGTWFGWLPEKL